jgi:hypothetical protein
MPHCVINQSITWWDMLLHIINFSINLHDLLHYVINQSLKVLIFETTEMIS